MYKIAMKDYCKFPCAENLPFWLTMYRTPFIIAVIISYWLFVSWIGYIALIGKLYLKNEGFLLLKNTVWEANVAHRPTKYTIK